MTEWISAFSLLLGAVFFLISALGILKLPDIFTRMHAAAKSSSLGIGLTLSGVIFHFTDSAINLKCAFIILFTFLTAPVAAQILSWAGYRSGAKISDLTVIDEIEDSTET